MFVKLTEVKKLCNSANNSELDKK